MDFYIWRDRFDRDAFMIGDRSGNAYTCWAFVYSDGLSEMFGNHVHTCALDLEQDEVLHVTASNISVEAELAPRNGG